ncbi:MAG TPA: nucleotidyltransferase domain-containing protein [Rhizobiaceae bacterium]|nr:nucleotidyltransferase domain-containing protein [Rhizobiaceae bacterium]
MNAGFSEQAAVYGHDAPARAVRPNFGRFGSEKEALDAMVAALTEALDPHAIWLFGSRARGDARPDSDFDLLVVAKPDGRFGSDDYDAVDEPIRSMRIGCDIVPCSHAAYVAGLGLNTSLVAAIHSFGKLLAGRAEP